MVFCGESSTWAKVALLLSVVALGLQCAGYGTNYWMARYTVREQINFGIGLWKMTDCSGGYKAACTDSDIPDSYINNLLQATRAMASFALVVMFVGAVCLGFYVGSQRSRTRGMAIAIMVLLFVAAAFGITAMIVWLVSLLEYHYPSWSFGLTVFAITLNITAAVLLIPDIREYDYKDLLKVGGQFANLEVTRDSDTPHPPPAPAHYDPGNLRPTIEPQGKPPLRQELIYNKKKKMDGF